MNNSIYLYQNEESTFFTYDPTRDCHHFEIMFRFHLNPSPNIHSLIEVLVSMASTPTTSIAEAIDNHLRQLQPFWNQLETQVRETLKNWFQTSVSAVIHRMPEGCNQANIILDVCILWGADEEPEVDEEEEEEEIIEMSMNEAQNNATVRAEESAIKEALVSKTVSLTKIDLCAICMEDFGEGVEGFEMPCKHFFHKECVLKWLNVSHYCPCCRFKLRTAE